MLKYYCGSMKENNYEKAWKQSLGILKSEGIAIPKKNIKVKKLTIERKKI